tara:strand:- start:176 stop:346 length:171 start_codon:yes stop_codon:yes gene_type:complete
MCITCKGFRGEFAKGFGGFGFLGFGLSDPAMVPLLTSVIHSYRQSSVVARGRKNVI